VSKNCLSSFRVKLIYFSNDKPKVPFSATILESYAAKRKKYQEKLFGENGFVEFLV